MNCKNCNESLSEGAIFCGNCGIKCVNEPLQIAEKGKTNDNLKVVLYLCLIVGGIAAIIAMGPLWIIAIVLFLLLIRTL